MTRPKNKIAKKLTVKQQERLADTDPLVGAYHVRVPASVASTLRIEAQVVLRREMSWLMREVLTAWARVKEQEHRDKGLLARVAEVEKELGIRQGTVGKAGRPKTELVVKMREMVEEGGERANAAEVVEVEEVREIAPTTSTPEVSE